jgi:hypothetical protein
MKKINPMAIDALKEIQYATPREGLRILRTLISSPEGISSLAKHPERASAATGIESPCGMPSVPVLSEVEGLACTACTRAAGRLAPAGSRPEQGTGVLFH